MFGLASTGVVSCLVDYVLFRDSPLTRVSAWLTLGVLGIWGILLPRTRRSGEPTPLPAPDAPLIALTESSIGYSIVIPAYNASEDLCKLVVACVALVDSEAEGDEVEIIVVDDGSTDSTIADLALIQHLHPEQIRVIQQVNCGVASARNLGAISARGRKLIFIDSDCVPRPGWLSNLPRLLGPMAVTYAHVVSDRKPYYPLEVSPSGAEFPGASFAILREDYLRVGGMCERFGHHLEDSDFFLKCGRGGFVATLAREAEVWHPIRRRSLRAIWRNAQLHSFDALLLKRNGNSSYPFLRSVFAGVNVGPYFATSLMVSFLLCQGLVILILPGARNGELQWLVTICLVTAAYLIGVAASAVYLSVPLPLWLKYYGSVVTYMIGSVVGRIRGSIEFGIIVL
jgi:glycosyltransferase involved in cell wall biosynthesis